MATDAQVKEIALLKEYANRLDGFKDAILGGCMVLQNKAEAILDNLQNESNITDNNLRKAHIRSFNGPECGFRADRL